MAPINPDLENVQEGVKNVIQDLFQVLVQVSNYDSTSRPTRDGLAQDFNTLDATLGQLHTTALNLPSPPPSDPASTTTPSTATADKGIPEPLIQYVENGRNPDIYTREFVELVRRMNQLARGKTGAFRGFRDVLAREMGSALPELRADVERVVEATGGVTVEGGEGEGRG
ncbi:mediator complex, subunit Med10 [Staphylotrichum tortipilum]|uniref:Mediator of RNA polymerase II transcription subunit 10 n=1 Tax=Staphylotrichum tortipilum TaxID=2831512 RepID=A0AAN6MRH2_9PEZI|nr:mediator complex, subunit Med10 [Staphylotrichum longicolle]